MGPPNTTAKKRHASRSPDDRSAKRHAPSSPEEGEVDDGSPSRSSMSVHLPPSIPPKPVPAPSKGKVAFPFKKRLQGGRSTFEPKDTPGVFERPNEEEYMRNSENNWRPSNSSGNRNSSPDRRRNTSSRAPAPRHESRRSRSRSPRSRRSRTPDTPRRHEIHRLPPPRTPSNFSPVSTGSYGRDGRSRMQPDLDAYDRRQGADWDRPSGNERHYRPGLYSRNDYHSMHLDDRDRDNRDNRDNRWSGYRRDERDLDRDRDRDYRRRGEERYLRRPLTPPFQSMLPPPEPRSTAPPPQPKTPPPPPPPPDSRLSNDLTLPQEHKAVSIVLKRQPHESHDDRSPHSHSRPPTLTELMQKEEERRREERREEEERKEESHSRPPTSTELVQMEERRREERRREEDRKEEGRREEDRKREEAGKREEARKREDGWKRQDKNQLLPPKPHGKREPVRRSPEEEFKAYGRKFEGCGMQSDYDVTTKLGEGTFGEVHKAIHKESRKVVALKRILMHNEKEGMPVTALREIKILKALNHPSIVDILDMFVVRSSAKDPLSVYMVFPYMDHDLAGLLENDRVKLQPSHIKLYMKQLLEGTEYMHRNHILHRDMKAANLLISNTGSLRIADFGLARAYDTNITRVSSDGRQKDRKYTNCVVTRWYRPPELLLGARQYGGEVDLWGIGCVLGEMFIKRPILPGTSDLDQLEKIWQLCGTPNQHTWPNFDALPGCEGVKRFQNHSRRIKTAFDSVGSETCDLLEKLLTCNPRERITAADALDHEYFWTEPLPADPKTLPSYEASHEFDKRGQRHQHPPAMQHPPHIPPYSIQNSRGRTGPGNSDFHHNGPGAIRNPQHNQHNRHVPYPPLPGPSHGPHGGPSGPHHGRSYNSHGPPPNGFPHPPKAQPSDFDQRNRSGPPSNSARFNSGGGGGRGPPHNYNGDSNSRPRGDHWVPGPGGSHPPQQLPSHLPQRPSAPMGLPPSHPRDSGRHGDPPRPPGGMEDKDKLNYG